MQKSATPSSPIAQVEQAAPGRIAAWWNTRTTLALLWLGAVLALAGVLLIYFHPWGSVAGAGGDFQPFYTAAQAIRQGHDPYQARVSALQQAQQADANNGYDYQYPPPFALALVPLSLLPFTVALGVWIALSVVCFVLTVVLLLRVHPPQHWLHWAALIIICFAVTGMFRDEIKNGQVDIFLTFLVACSYVAFARQRSILAGVLLALASVVKPFFGLLFFYFLWKRAYRAALSFLVTTLICFGLSVLALGWQALVEWVEIARYLGQVPYAAARHVISFQALLLRWIDSFTPAAPWGSLVTWPATLGMLVLAVIVCGLALRFVRRQNTDEETSALEFALCVVGILFAFPVIEDIHTVALVAPLTLLTAAALRLHAKGQIGTGSLALVGVAFLYFMDPLLPRLQWANNAQPITGWLVPETGAYLLGLAFLFGLLCALLATRSRARLLPSGTIAAIV